MIDNYNLFNLPPERTEDLAGLTYRQQCLHDYLLDFYRSYEAEPSLEEILNNLDDLYGFTAEKEKHPHRVFNNMTCRRDLSFDLEKLSFALGTNYIFTGHGYTDKTWQIEKRIRQLLIEGKRAFKKMAICQLKAAQRDQMVFNLDNGEIERIETQIRKYDEEIVAEQEKIKELERGNI